MLAAFIDVVVFLLAFATGPYFFGATEHRWVSAGAALEGLDHQIFTRDFLRKLTPGPRGMARVEASALTPGEQQLCLLWAAEEAGGGGGGGRADNTTCWSREFTNICWNRWRPSNFRCERRRWRAQWRTHSRAASHHATC